jgi:rhodanese-related sulfurtransferase
MNLNQEQWWHDCQADENAIILDVRTSDEFEDGFIPGAINIDIYKGQGFIYEVDSLDKTKNFYVYCRSGGRSSQACSVLKQHLGIENTFNLLDGFMNWQNEVDFPK